MVFNNREEFNWQYKVFIIIFYLLIFKDAFLNIFSFFQYIDEIIAILAIPIFFINLYKNRGIIYLKCEKYSYYIFLYLYIFIGVMSNIIYQYQSLIDAVLPDIFINLKFWWSIYVAKYLLGDIDFTKNSKKIVFHIKFVITIYIILFIYHNIFGEIFPESERFGFKVTWLFYEVHTFFVAICIFLISLSTMVKPYFRYNKLYMAILLILLCSNLRFKAFGAAAIYVILYYFILYKNKIINKKLILLIGIFCLLIGFTQLEFYFFSEVGENTARFLLLTTAFNIVKDYFPLGTGFATFASYYSSVDYSPIYYMYDIYNVYGISEVHPVYITDSFWPMILGQTGIIGTIIYILIIRNLYKQIKMIKDKNKYYYVAAIYAFFYLCISSTSETAFVSPISIPLALIIGICIKTK